MKSFANTCLPISLDLMERITIKFKRTKEFILLLLALFVLICGLWMLSIAENSNEKVLGYGVLIFFGLLLLIVIKQFFLTVPHLIIIDDEGIEDTALSVGKIIWTDIEAAYPNNILTNKFISLKIREVKKYLSRLPKSSRIIASANRGSNFEEFNLHLVGSTIPQEDILAEIKARILLN